MEEMLAQERQNSSKIHWSIYAVLLVFCIKNAKNNHAYATLQHETKQNKQRKELASEGREEKR